MKIVVFKYGQSIYNENFIFRGGDKEKMLPISFSFYLLQSGNRNILIDPGCNDGAGFEMSLFVKPEELLRQYGISTQEITDVVITHAHHDHIEAVGAYKNAVIHIQREEYETGKKYIPQDFKVRLFEEEEELLEGLQIKKIGGHSVGSSIVIWNGTKKRYIFCGDECYVEACFIKKIPTGASVEPKISEAFIKDYGKENDRHCLCHDPEILKERIGYEVLLEE